MNRRSLILAATLALPQKGLAAAKPWTARLLSGGFDGTAYAAGILLHLSPGWKTYWRVPGAGGVPPEITVTGGNVKSFSFQCPLPQRLAGPEGENIGYHDAVCFPLRIEPADIAKPVQARINFFAGVCETICIPLQAVFDFADVPESQPAGHGADLQAWQMKVPDPSSVISSATFEAALQVLTISGAVEVSDVFIECQSLPQLFNTAPQRRDGKLQVKIIGLPAGQDLSGKQCRFTLATPSGGLEQTLTVG